MKHSPRTLSKVDSIRRFSVMHRKRKGDPHTFIYRMISLEERIFFLHAWEIIDEFDQIIIFIKKIEQFGFDNSETLGKILFIQSELRSIRGNYKYCKIISILEKYLNGIKNFTVTTNMNSVFFYKKLFESILVAVARELHYLNEEPS